MDQPPQDRTNAGTHVNSIPNHSRVPQTAPLMPELPASESRPIRVLIADDHRMIRHLLRSVIESFPDLSLVGEAVDGEQAVELARALLPDVVLMDISMPRLNGLEATKLISSDCPGVAVIGLSINDEAEMVAAMRRAGAVAYLVKGGPSDELYAAIVEVRSGGSRQE